jgi:hexokinase
MAIAQRGRYTDYIGFILATGTNMCCILPAASITKSPEAVSMGGEMIVNMESGCFDKLLLGTADRELDAESEIPGDHLAEKMISGSYYRQVLERTLLLAAREGDLSGESAERLRALRLTSALVDAFCLDPHGDNPLAQALATQEDQTFASGINMALLERASRVAAAGMVAVIRKRELPRGSRVCVSADGTMLRLNPVLKPTIERYLAEYAGEGLGVATEFLFASDATLLGSAWAGLID